MATANPLHLLGTQGTSYAVVSEAGRLQHTYIGGTTGTGKTELFKTLIYSYVSQPTVAAVVVIDPAGDMVDQIAHWPEFVGNHRLAYLNPTLARGMTFCINPFETVWTNSTSDEAVYAKRVLALQLIAAFQEVLGSGIGSELSLNMRSLLKPCVLALMDWPGATFHDLQDFMSLDDSRNRELVRFAQTRTHYKGVAEFFTSEFRNNKRFGVTKNSISTKLDDLLTGGFFADMTCGKSTVDLEQLIEQKKVILFNLAKGEITDEESQAFGRLIMAMLQGMAMRRVRIPEAKRTMTHVFIDEAQNYINSTVATILREARKFKLVLTMAQPIDDPDVTPRIRKIVTGIPNMQISGYCQPSEQRDAAQLVRSTPEQINGLGKGEFIIRVGRESSFRFKNRSDLVGHRHSMTAPAWGRLVGRQIRSYYRSKNVDPAAEAHIAEDHDQPAPEQPPASEWGSVV